MDVDECNVSCSSFSLEMQSASSKRSLSKVVLTEISDAPVEVRSFDGEEETFLALKLLEAEREVQVSGCFQKYVSFRPYIVAWIYDTCLRCPRNLRPVLHYQLLRRLGLSWRCTYAAVQYTDRLFSKIHLTRRSYQLTAAAAIAVAAKVEEAFDEIPSLSMILMADEVRISFIRFPSPDILIVYHSVGIMIAISFGGLNCFCAHSYIGVCGPLLSNTFWSA
jgi:hypothetical protein